MYEIKVFMKVLLNCFVFSCCFLISSVFCKPFLFFLLLLLLLLLLYQFTIRNFTHLMWVYYVLGAMFCYGAAKTVYQKFVQKGIVSEEEFILSKWYRKQQKRLKRLRSSSLFPLKIMDHSQETTLPQSIHSRSMSLDRKPDTFKGPPMVIIPGLMGSRLSCKGMKVDPVSSLCQTMFDQWTNLWVSIESVFPSFLGGNCWESNIKPLYDMNKNEWVNSPQLTVEADDFGTTKTFDTLITFFGIKKWSIFYFQKFTDYLRYQYNYKDGQNLFGAGYDFRVNLSPSYRQAYHKRLKLLIERAFNQNSNQKVWLVTHSMGCPTAQVFLCNAVDSAWKSKYIAGFIPIAGPFGGSPKAFQAILSGVDMVVMSPEKVKSIAQSMSGTAWMLPNPQIFALPNSVVCSEHKFSYRTKDMESMFSSAGLPNSYLAGIKTHVFRTQQSFFKAPNVNTYPVCGSCVQSLVGDTSDDDNDGIEDEVRI